MANVEQFQLLTAVKGSFDDIDVDISSDLDRQLKDSVQARLNKKQKELEVKLKANLET